MKKGGYVFLLFMVFLLIFSSIAWADNGQKTDSLVQSRIYFADNDSLTFTPLANSGDNYCRMDFSGDELTMVQKAAKDYPLGLAFVPKINDKLPRASLSIPYDDLCALLQSNISGIKIVLPFANLIVGQQSLTEIISQKSQLIFFNIEKNKYDDSIRVNIYRDQELVMFLDDIYLSVPQKDIDPCTIAYLLDDNGQKKIISHSFIMQDRILAFLPGSARIKIEHRDIVFSDTASHWAKESISFVAARNIFTGYSDDRFLPDYYMNRSMLITVLYRLSDPYERNNTRLLQEGAFNDVNPNAYYSAAVIWGFDNNIISGIGQEQFMPEEPITRQELALILCNYAKYLGMDVSDIEGMSIRNYSDYENIAPWAINAFRWALNSGLMQGKTPEKLDPQGIATRGEVATILYRFIGYCYK